MIRPKLSEDVLLQLEILNEAKNKRTLEIIRVKLREYFIARKQDGHTVQKKNIRLILIERQDLNQIWTIVAHLILFLSQQHITRAAVRHLEMCVKDIPWSQSW